MSKFSINTENLKTPIKTFGDASGKLKDYSSELENVSQNLDSSFSEVVPVVEALARRTNDHSGEVQVLGITLSNASNEYVKYDQLVTNRVKKSNLDKSGKPKADPTSSTTPKDNGKNDPFKNVSDSDLESLRRRYNISPEDFEFLKKNYPGLVLSLYATDRYSHKDAEKVMDQIRDKLPSNDTGSTHSKPSGDGGRQVNTDSPNHDPSNWYSQEQRDKINYWAKKIVGDDNTVNKDENGVLTDKDGRYWVAVGPNVMDPNFSGNAAPTAGDMKYGTKIDVVLEDANGNRKYVYCTVGDCKAHTYPDGVHQTGNAFPNGCDPHPQNADSSVVEFIGYTPEELKNGYKVVEVIVYD